MTNDKIYLTSEIKKKNRKKNCLRVPSFFQLNILKKDVFIDLKFDANDGWATLISL